MLGKQTESWEHKHTQVKMRLHKNMQEEIEVTPSVHRLPTPHSSTAVNIHLTSHLVFTYVVLLPQLLFLFSVLFFMASNKLTYQ